MEYFLNIYKSRKTKDALLKYLSSLKTFSFWKYSPFNYKLK